MSRYKAILCMCDISKIYIMVFFFYHLFKRNMMKKTLTKSEREYGSNSVTYWVYVCHYVSILWLSRVACRLKANDISVTRSYHREADGRYRKSFLFCFTIVRTMEVFHREIWYNRLVEHGIKLLCRYPLLGPWKSMKGIRKFSIGCTESAAGLQD